MNIFNSNYIGATGVYPIYEYVDDTSNALALNNKWINHNEYIQYSNVQVHSNQIRIIHDTIGLTKYPIGYNYQDNQYYTASGLKPPDIGLAFTAFNGSLSSYFRTNFNYNEQTGLFSNKTGTIISYITDVDNIRYDGEWLKVDLKEQIIFYKE